MSRASESAKRQTHNLTKFVTLSSLIILLSLHQSEGKKNAFCFPKKPTIFTTKVLNMFEVLSF